MSAAHAARASPRVRLLHGALSVVRDASEQPARATKRRLTAELRLVHTVLGERAVRDALSHHARRELATGAVVALDDPDAGGGGGGGAVCTLSWAVVVAELACAANGFVREEAAKSKRSFAVAAQCLQVLLAAVKMCVAECGAEVLRDLTLALVKFVATWVSEAKAVDLMLDSWRLVQAMMEHPCLREMVAPTSYKFLVTACFHQLAGGGEYFREDPALFTQVRHVFVLLATATPNGTTMLEKCSAKFGKGDASKGMAIYAVILDKACRMLLLAKEMPPSRQRDLQATALAAISAVMSERMLELHASRAAQTLLDVATPSAVALWSEKRHRPSALLFTRCIVRLLPCAPDASSTHMNLLRRRVNDDFHAFCRSPNRSGVAHQGSGGVVLTDLEDHLVDAASFLTPVDAVITSVAGATTVPAAVAWLRVLHAQMARRTNHAAIACLRAVQAVVRVYAAVARDAHALPPHCAVWCCRVVSEAASMAACFPSACSRARRSRARRRSSAPRRPTRRRAGAGTAESEWSRGAVAGSAAHGTAPVTGAAGAANARGAGASQLPQTGFGSVPGEASFSPAVEASATPRDSETDLDSDCRRLDVPDPGGVWAELYECLVRQLMRGRMAARRTGAATGASGVVSAAVCDAEIAVLDVMTLLMSIGAVTGPEASAAAASAGSVGGPDSLWSLPLFDTCVAHFELSSHALSFLRTHIAVAGFAVGDGGGAKLKLVRMLAGLCELPSASSKSPEAGKFAGRSIVNAASAAVGLVRGSCRLEAVADTNVSTSDVEEPAPEPVAFFDATHSLLWHGDETSSSAAVAQSNYFQGVKSRLERVVFRAGGGWDDSFLLGDRDYVPSPELVLQRKVRPARAHVDRELLHGLEDSLLAVLVDIFHCCDIELPVACDGEDSNLRGQPGAGKRVVTAGEQETLNGGVDDVDREYMWTGNVLEGGEDCEDDGLNGDASTGTKPFPSVRSAIVAVRIIAFICEYIAEGIHVGTLSMAPSSDGASENSDSAAKLGKFLMRLSQSLGSSMTDASFPLTHFLDNPEALEVLRFAVGSSGRVVQAIKARQQLTAANNESCGIAARVSRVLTLCLLESVTNAVLDHLCTHVRRFGLESVSAASASISPLQAVSLGRNVGVKRGRGAGKGQISDHAHAAKRRKKSDAFSSDEESDEEGPVFDMEASRGSDEIDDLSGTDGREALGDRESGQDQWGAPNKDMGASTFSNQPPIDGHGPGGVASSFYWRSTTIHNLCLVLGSVQEIVVDVAEQVQAKIEELLKELEVSESINSSDGERRYVVASEVVCAPYFSVRESIWNLLLHSGKMQAAEIAAKDMLRAGRRCLGLLRLTDLRQKSFANIFDVRTPRHFLRSWHLEGRIVLLLRFFSKYADRCLGVGISVGGQMQSIESRLRLLRDVSKVVEEVIGARVRRSSQKGVSGSDASSKDEDNAKLPTAAKFEIARLGVTLAVLTRRCLQAEQPSTAESNKVSEDAVKGVCKYIVAMFQDSDVKIRLCAAGVSPIVLHLPYFGDQQGPAPWRFSSFRKLLPALDPCSEPQYSGHAGDGSENIFVAESTVPSDYINSLIDILPGLKHVGATAFGSSTLLSIGEVATLCSESRGAAIEDIFQHVAASPSSSPAAFGVLVRLACRTGYASTADLFHVFRRDVLRLWLDRNQNPVRGSDVLGDFPVTLVTPGNRSCDAKEVYYEWLGMHVDELLPLVLAGDDPNTLTGTVHLAEELSMNVHSLLVSYKTHVYRVFASTFVGSMDRSRARTLWTTVVGLTSDSSSFKKLPKASSGLYSLLCTVLMSSSCTFSLADTISKGNVRRAARSQDKLGFTRDGTQTRAPEYDPMVVASTVNYLCAVGSRHQEQLQVAITTEQMQGSIFARNGVNLDFFASFAQDNPLFLAQAMARVWEGMIGPPCPPSMQCRVNAFASFAILYRACKKTLLAEVSLRFAFFDLIICGFRFPETAKNALWLLRDASNLYVSMEESDDIITLEDSSWLGLHETQTATYMKDFLARHLEHNAAWRWWEILEMTLPGLFAIACAPGDDPLIEFARYAAKDMVQRAMPFPGVLGVLDFFPVDVKAFKEIRKEQEESFQRFCLDSREKVEYGLLRFSLQNARANSDSAVLHRRLRSLRVVLEAHRSELHSMFMVHSEATCADSSEISMFHQLASDATRMLVSVVEECVHSDSHIRPQVESRRLMDQSLISSKGTPSPELLMPAVEEEAVRCLGLLGAVWPASLSIVSAHEETVLSEVESPGAHCATILLCRELRSPSPVARRVAVETLASFFASGEGRVIWTYAMNAPWRRDFTKEFGIYQPQKPTKLVHVSIRDPVTGYEVDGSAFDALNESAWSLSSYRGVSVSGIPSAWVRRLSASLAIHSDSDALSLLQASCFSSAEFAAGMFPHLLYDVVEKYAGNSSVLRGLANVITNEILEGEDIPVGALKLVVGGIDALCEIGVSQLRSQGSARKLGSLWWDREIYVLGIPYMVLANAANRCGEYCSALRYASLHVNHASRIRENELRKRSSTWGIEHDRALDQEKLKARLEAGAVVSNALRHVREPDGQRAVPSRGGIAERAAVVASVDSDWSRVLGAQDALQGLASRNCYNKNPLDDNGTDDISFARERDVLRSLFGLGALHSIVKYWHGLRQDTVGRAFVRRSNVSDEDFASVNGEAVGDLVDLRFQAAWQLGQWQTPPTIPSGSSASDAGCLGLHESIHASLRSLISGDVGGALSWVAEARSGIAVRMAEGMSGSLIASIRDVSHELLLVEDVFLSATVLAQSQEDRGRSFRTLVGSSLGSYPPVAPNDTNSVVRAGREQIAKLKKGYGVPTAMATKSLRQIAGLQSAEKQFQGEKGSNGSLEESSIVARFWELRSIWRQRDMSSRNSVEECSYTQTDPIPRPETVLSLRLALARTLGVKEQIAGLSAELASFILKSDRGQGAWARAATALGNSETSFLRFSSHLDAGAWKLAEAQLCWRSGEDGSSKQYALASVKEIIENRLGGRLTAELPNAEESATESIPQFRFDWTELDIPSSRSVEVALVRAKACRLAAEWSTSMRAEEAMVLFHGYLRMGLESFRNIETGVRSDGKCAAHFAMAGFADEQMQSIERYRKSKEYEFTAQSVERTERMISKLEKKLQESFSATSKQRSAVERHIRGRLVDLERDQGKLEKLELMQRRWCLLAVKNYASCLSQGDSHDLHSCFRLVALWTEHGVISPDLNAVLVSGEGGEEAVRVPTNKLLPAAPQIASRIGKSGLSLYDRTVAAVFAKMASNHPQHCLWQLIALSSLTRDPPSGMRGAELYVADEQKKQAADMIMATVKKSHRMLVSQTCELADYLFAVSEIPKGRRQNFPKVLPGGRELHVAELNLVAVPTVSLPLYGFGKRTGAPTVRGFEKRAKVLGGKSAPMLLHCVGSDGKKYPLIVKYMDDMRQDAIMEQMFAILNELLSRNGASSARNLWIRTYRVVPLSPFAGIMQFVRNTEQLRTWLLGSDPDGNAGGHARHRPPPVDWKNSKVFSQWVNLFHNKRSKAEDRVRFMKKIWSKFRPVFRYFFLETFLDPADWHARQLSYTRSCALMSIVGWMIGLGDRHLSNILIDSKTAEVIHIDFGYVFEASKLLPTPEQMPFRLSRDIVDGMGIDGVEGVFRTCCEVTMKLLRENKGLLLMVFQVFLHDPLFDWSLSPLKVLEEDRSVPSSARDGVLVFGTEDDDDAVDGEGDAGLAVVSSPSKNADDGGGDKALYALTRVSEKLDGLEATDRLSVEAHVARLIDEARSVEIIGSAYIGWAPHV